MKLLHFKLLSLAAVFSLPLSAQTLYVPSGTSGVGSSSNGNVGVGTANPVGKLHVNGDLRLGAGYGALSEVPSNAATILGNNVIAGAGANTVKRYFDDANYGAFLRINNNGLTFHNITSQSYGTEVSYDTGELFRITSGGNVGIGTTNPGAALDVIKPGNSNVYENGVRANRPDAQGQYAFMGYAQSSADAYFGSVYTGSTGVYGSIHLRQYTAGMTARDALNIDSSGNVGVGTTSPSSILELKDAIPLLSINGTNATGFRGTIFKLNGAAFASDTADAQSGEFRRDVGSYLGWGGFQTFYTDTVERIRITATGNVGIGTTSPSHKLAVNGTIRAKEVIVETGWSDYVFADDYRLAPLSEVESHIKAEKHLPGIPSAKEVAEHGVSVGEMQSKLLAKVEELTLHLIAQQKELTAQRDELRALRQQNQEILSRSHP